MSHTSGPWRSGLMGLVKDGEAYTRPNYFGVVAGKGFFSEKGDCGFEITAFMSEADARLIAASPDLLEALEKLEAMYDDFSRRSFDLEEIRSILKTAIAKAKGGPP